MGETTLIMRRVVYVIMNKDRTLIVKGTRGSRALVKVKNRKDRKQIATFFSRRIAELSLYSDYANETNIRCSPDDLEIVKCYITLTEI